MMMMMMTGPAVLSLPNLGLFRLTLFSCSFPSAINSLTASSAASCRAAFLLGADASGKQFSPTFTLYMNLRGKEEESLLDPCYHGFFIFEAAACVIQTYIHSIEETGLK